MKKRDIILHEISRVAEKIFGNGGGCVYLYGSQARKDARPDSDWDLLIITDSTADTEEDFADYAFPFAEIGWHLGAQITPILYSRAQWEAQRDTAFFLNVTSEAILL